MELSRLSLKIKMSLSGARWGVLYDDTNVVLANRVPVIALDNESLFNELRRDPQVRRMTGGA